MAHLHFTRYIQSYVYTLTVITSTEEKEIIINYSDPISTHPIIHTIKHNFGIHLLANASSF